MTVTVETPYAERIYTGVQTIFTPDFTAQDPAHVFVGYFDQDLLPVPLIKDVHFTVSLDASGYVTVGRIAFPSASVAAPVTIFIERITPATQVVNFMDLARYSAEVHEKIADAGAMRDAELRSRQDRTATPFAVSDDVVDFRPRRLKAADPVLPEDLVTKNYADENTGTAAAAEAKGYRDEVVVLAGQVSDDAAEAEAAKNAAVTAAAILGNPDDGFLDEVVDLIIDDGTFE